MKLAIPAVLITLAAVLIAGCGGSSSPTAPSTNPGNNSGSITLTGAVSGTVPFTSIVAGYSNADTASAVGGQYPATINGVAYTLTLAPGWHGDFQVKTYNSSDVGARGAITLATPTYVTWGAITGTQSQGSYTVTITSIGTAVTTSAGKAYPNAHGTITAVMPALTATGASGTVSLSVTF